MIQLFFILIVLVLIYAVVFLTLIIFWNKKDNVQKKIEQIPVSVIIPFRNEEKNLRECIDGILNQNYNQQKLSENYKYKFIKENVQKYNIPNLNDWGMGIHE